MYDNILFDLYGTLIDIKTNETKASLWKQMTLIYGYYGAAYTPQELKKSYHTDIRRREEQLRQSNPDIRYPEMNIEDTFSQLYRDKGIMPTEAMVIEAAHAFRAASMTFIRLFPGTREMLMALKKAGKKVFLLSNAQRVFTYPEMISLGIVDCFDGIYMSSDFACKKPDLHFYETLLNAEGLDPKKTIMVGNEAVCDIQGAAQIGLDTLYIVSPQTPSNDPPVTATYQLNEMDMEQVRTILLTSREN